MNRDMRDYKQLLRVLENGYMMTHDEMKQVAEIIKVLKADADRYRWLNRSTAQLFKQVDRAMNGGRE